MEKQYVFISGDIFIGLEDSFKKTFSNKLKEFNMIDFCFVTNNSKNRKIIENFGFLTFKRGKPLNILAKLPESVLFLGFKLYDFTTAHNNNMFLVYLSELKENFEIDEKVLQYGFEINYNEFFKILELINNSAPCFLRMNILEKYEIISLINARSKHWTLSESEKNIAGKFEDLLKRNVLTYKKIFIFFIVIMILKNINISEYDNCFYYPTSKEGGKNELMEELCKYIRLLCKKPRLEQENLFYRNKAIIKSHIIKDNTRIPIKRHIESIKLISSKRIKNKNIIVLDDYMTNGTSSETVRELLKTTEVNNVLFLTIGHFGNPYMQFNSSGDYNNIYSYQQISCEFNKDNSHKNLKDLFEMLYK